MFGEKTVRTRKSSLYTPGRRIRSGDAYGLVYNYLTTATGFLQRTESRDSGFRQMQKIANDPAMPAHIRRFASSRDEGTQFMTESIKVTNSHMDNVSVTGAPGGGFYQGPVMAINVDSVLPSLQSTTDKDIEMLELFGLGGTAINRTMPLSPDVDLAVTFGELRKDGLPSLVGRELLRRQTLSRKEYLKGSSKEYLNLQFGILPLARDISALANSARRSAMQIKQMYRDAQRTIRRRYEFPVSETTSETVMLSNVSPYCWGGAYASCFTFTGKVVRKRVERRETWFSGRYRYYLPEGDALADKAEKWLAEADRLYGVKITPETLWNIQPWLWLSDWFVTLGNVVSNVSRMKSDRIALQYGYIMRRTTITDTYTCVGSRPRGNFSGKPIDYVTTTVKYVRKVRYPATPYGFGLSTAEFTPQQWAILGALGITRAPGRF